MKLRISIDVFSGRPNPVIQLQGREADEAVARLRPADTLSPDEIHSVLPSTLGYRGLLVELVEGRGTGLPQMFRLVGGSLLGPRLAHRVVDESFEEYVCGSTGPVRRLQLGHEFPLLLLREIKRFRESRERHHGRPAKWSPAGIVTAPLSTNRNGGMTEARSNSAIIATIMPRTIGPTPLPNRAWLPAPCTVR